MFLRQSTASQEIPLGPFLDDTDGKTAETALSIANTDIKIWKTGAASEVSKNSGGATHMASGRYVATLDATDTDTIGPLEVNVHVSGALPVKVRANVLSAAVYDVMFGTVAPATSTNITAGTITTATNLTNLPSIPANWLTAAGIAANALDGKGNWNVGKTGYSLTAGTGLGNQTADITGSLSGSVGSVTGNVGGSVGSVASGGITSASFAANSITAASLAADAGAEIADAVWDEAISGHLTAGSTGAALNGAGSAGDPWTTTLPGSYTGSQAGKILADILADTGTDGVAIATGTRDAIAGAVWDVDRSLHTTGGTFGYGVNSVGGSVGWVNGPVYGGVQGGVDSIATGGITAASFAANAITAASLASDVGGEIADAVWDESRSGHTTAGTFGLFLDAQVSTVGGGGLTAGAIADAVWDEARSGHTTAGTFGEGVIVQTNSDKTGYSLTTAPPTAAAIADAVWDESRTGHTTAGTFGFYLDGQITAVSTGGVSVAAIADAVWDEARADHATAGSFGEAIQIADATIVAAGSTASTVQLASPWNTGEASDRTLYLSRRVYTLGSAAGDTYSISPTWTPPGSNTPCQIGPLKSPTVAEVTAGVWAATTRSLTDKVGFALSATGLDAISVADFAGAANTIPKMIVRLFRRFYGKVAKTATTITTYADDGTTVRTTQAISASGDNENQGAAS